MIAVLVRFEVKPESAEAFHARVAQQAADSLRLEPGCRRFDVWTSVEKSEEIMLYELYDDGPAFHEAHLHSAHFKAFDAACADMVVAKEVRIYDNALGHAS